MRNDEKLTRPTVLSDQPDGVRGQSQNAVNRAGIVDEGSPRASRRAIDSNGRTIWIADAHRDDGKRFVVHADEKLTAFWNLNR